MNIFKIFKKKTKEPVNSQLLTDLVSGMQNAASSAQKMGIQHNLAIIDRFFDRAEDGALTPKLIDMALDDEHNMEIPLISLIKPSNLHLDEMQIAMSVKLDSQEVEALQSNLNTNTDTCSAFRVFIAPKLITDHNKRPHDVIEVNLKFKAVESAEGLERIIEEYSRLIQPYKTK